MLFNSFPFILGFLPVTLVGFFALGRRHPAAAAAWLTSSSIFFYGWWNPRYVALLIASVLFNYVLGLLITRPSAQGRPGRREQWLAFAVAANLALLGYYKYANFFLDSAGALVGSSSHLGEIILPLGISFFTFTQISFLVDTYRGDAREYNLIHYALFVTYFPHLIAGPILHHQEMMPQFERRGTYRLDLENLAVGLTIFSLGLFKKVVIADTAGIFSTPIFEAAAGGASPSFPAAWGAALAYTFQLYFDFSGYSDMAIGLSRMFGIDLPLNFNSPYKATSIIDFWRRWHMTLSRFLRDYLYFPLGGGRAGPAWRYVNLTIAMLLGGLWHGAGWTFVVWGGIHGLYLIVNHAWRALKRRLGYDPAAPTWAGGYVARTLTFLAVVVGWVFFRASSLDAARRILEGMAAMHGFALPDSYARAVLTLPIVPVMADLGWPVNPLALLLSLGGVLLALVWWAPNTQELMGRYSTALDPYPGGARTRPPRWLQWRPTPLMAMVTGLILFLSLLALITETPSEFLYFQF